MIPFQTFQNAYEAIRMGQQVAPCGIAYAKGGWFLYDLKDGISMAARPEFLCIRLGVMPIPLNDYARDLLTVIPVYFD